MSTLAVLLSGLLAVFLLSTTLTWCVSRWGVALQLLDVPEARSAHQGITPRGGGLAIVLAFYLYSLLLLQQGLLDQTAFAVLSLAMPIALLGFIDDWRSLSHRHRLLVQALTALLVTALLGSMPPIQLGAFGFDPGWLRWVLLPLALIWLCNLYNFMDGIDALAATQCIFVAAAAAWFLMPVDPGLAWSSLALAVAAAGFLVWNRPLARVFMGDVGSTWIGFLFGLLILLSHYREVMSLWSWLLLLAVFVVDATVTLLRRMLRGDSAARAHSTHAYQHAARRLGGHGPVVFVVLLLNILYLLPLARLAHTHPEYGVLLAISGIVPLIVLAWFCGAGHVYGTDKD